MGFLLSSHRLKKQPEANNNPLTIAEKVRQSNESRGVGVDLTRFYAVILRLSAKASLALVEYKAIFSCSRSKHVTTTNSKN
jgi:hypothetical protein